MTRRFQLIQGGAGDAATGPLLSDGTTSNGPTPRWNVVNGCSVVSPGCTNCYAMRLAGTRLKHHPSRAG
jgi:hypothetical protein